MPSKWKFEAVPGIFFDPSPLQSSPDDKSTTQPELGLLNQVYPSDTEASSGQLGWKRFIQYVKSLNDGAPENVQYKVLYLTRHGLGFHNIKHAEVGDEEWNVSLPFQTNITCMNILTIPRTTGH